MMPHIPYSYPATTLIAPRNHVPQLTHDGADALYFERRDMNDSHERAINYVDRNGAPSNWNPPKASDYQGLPDHSHSESPRQLSPAHAGRSRAAANFPSIANYRQLLREDKTAPTTHVMAGLPPLGKIENFIFHRNISGRHYITAERKIGSIGGINPSGTTARLQKKYSISEHGYAGALSLAKDSLTEFNYQNGRN